eukprot:scaffold7203_cov63-Skeletonema_menzelii.AAC.1
MCEDGGGGVPRCGTRFSSLWRLDIVDVERTKKSAERRRRRGRWEKREQKLGRRCCVGMVTSILLMVAMKSYVLRSNQ